MILATLTALVVGLIGSAILFFVGFFVLFIGPAYGGAMAQAVTIASGRKRGPVLNAIAIGGIVVGALVMLFFMHAWVGIYSMVWRLVGVGLAISACYARMRYL